MATKASTKSESKTSSDKNSDTAKRESKPAGTKEKSEDTAKLAKSYSTVSSPVPRQLNDRRADDAPVIGHMVTVKSGKHEGRYGVFFELDGETAVVRLRDSAGERIQIPVSSLERRASLR